MHVYIRFEIPDGNAFIGDKEFFQWMADGLVHKDPTAVKFLQAYTKAVCLIRIKDEEKKDEPRGPIQDQADKNT